MNHVQQTKRRHRDMNRRGFFYPNRTNGVPYVRSDAQTILAANGKYVRVFPCKQCCGVKRVWDFSVRWQGTIVQCPTCKGTGHTKKVYVARTVQFRRLLPICSGASSGSTFLVSKDSRNGTVPRKQKHPRFLRMRYLRYSKKLRFYSDVHLGLFVRQNGGL